MAMDKHFAKSTEQTANDSISSAIPTQASHTCPLHCPNRQTRARQRVVGGGYLFALIVAALLGMQSLNASYKRINGEEDFLFATKSPPSAILIIGLTLIGLGLGIEIDKKTITSSAKVLFNGLVDSSATEEK